MTVAASVGLVACVSTSGDAQRESIEISGSVSGASNKSSRSRGHLARGFTDVSIGDAELDSVGMVTRSCISSTNSEAGPSQRCIHSANSEAGVTQRCMFSAYSEAVASQRFGFSAMTDSEAM